MAFLLEDGYSELTEPSVTKLERTLDGSSHNNEINIVLNIDANGKATSYKLVNLDNLSSSAKKLPALNINKISCCSCNYEHNLEIYVTPLDESTYCIPSTEIKPEEIYELSLETSIVKEEPWDDGAFEAELIEENSEEASEIEKPVKKKKSLKPITESVKCDSCEKSFTSSGSLKKHKKECNNDTGKMFSCRECTRSFPRIIQLRAHERHCLKEKRGEPTCTICQKKFSTWHSAYQHMDHIHYKIKPFICHECGKQFRSQKEVDEHLLRHENNKPYSCDLCKKRFPSRISIRQHIILNHIESVEGIVWCYDCNPPKKLLNQKRFELHQTKHQTAKNYPCPQCSRTFKNEANIKAHIYRFHVPMELKQKFTCDVDGCTFMTTVKAQFENHKFVHKPDSEKPFHCSYCGKGFINSNLKVRHERIHTGQRPFPCEVCGKAFRSRDDLKVMSYSYWK